MNYFNKIPDNFFSILASRNKGIYGLALVTLYDALILYHNKIRKSDYLDLLKSRGEKEINSLIIEEDDNLDNPQGLIEPTLSSKANVIVRRLVSTGWIIIDEDIKTGCEYILIPSYSISMLKIVYEFVQDNEDRYVSYVHSTFADLQLADEVQDEFMYRTLVNAYNKTRDLELEVTKLDHSIRVYHKQLGSIFSSNEILSQHFDVAREDVVDPIYHPLKTNDSIILYNGPIANILKKWLNTTSVRTKLIDQALILNHNLSSRSEAENDVIKKINYIQDTYAKLSQEMNDIDVSQSNYTKATAEKVIYLNNSDKTIKGKLESIFLFVAKATNGERIASTEAREIIKSINNSVKLYQQGYMDQDSLTKPYKRNPKYDGDPIPLDDYTHDIDQDYMDSLVYIMDAYSDDKIMDFMEKAFKDQPSIDVLHMDIKSVEDYIMTILGTVKADTRNSFYTYSREYLTPIVKEDKYLMPNFTYIRNNKEEK